MSIHSSVQNGTSEKAIETVRPEPALERSQTVHLSYPRFSAPRPLPTAAVSLGFQLNGAILANDTLLRLRYPSEPFRRH